MQEKLIGNRPVHPIGVGTWEMGGSRLSDGNVFADYRYDERDVAAIRFSISCGQNHIDTAQFYGAGHTEEIVGAAITGIERSSLFIATKVWRSHSLRHAVPHAAEESLQKLSTDYLDLLYVHSPWDAIPMEEYIAGLNDVLDAGLTRSIGVSNFTLDQLRTAVELSRNPIAALQIHYSLTERSAAPALLLDYCRSRNIAVVAYRPVERKLLTGAQVNPILARIAAKHDCPASQVAINWLITQPGVVTIPKASNTLHIEENIGALDLELDDSERAELDRIAG